VFLSIAVSIAWVSVLYHSRVPAPARLRRGPSASSEDR
jgi:hypothetical protein